MRDIIMSKKVGHVNHESEEESYPSLSKEPLMQIHNLLLFDFDNLFWF